MKKRILAVLMTSMIVGSCIPSTVAYADSVPIVTIGHDLDEEQKNLIFKFFGVAENGVDVIEVNNEQERQYLEGLIPDEVIGTRTLSCSYILPTTSGGIVVKTANLNWVSDGMLANALLTSGVENCQVLATAPFEVSGTGALTGVMLAYEKSSGEELDETKKSLATEELVITGEIVDEIKAEESDVSEEDSITEEQILALLNDIKSEVINGKLTEERVKEILDENLQEYKIALTEEMYNKLVAYLTKLSEVDYKESIKSNLSELTDRIKGGFNINIGIDIEFKTDKNALEQFWTNIFNWLRYLFGGIKTDAMESINIFDKVNTDVIEYDTPVEEEGGVDVE